MRYESDLIECQAAALYRRLGLQGDTGPVITESAGGTNLTCVLRPSERDYFYSQVIVGTGIGSYRGLPDVAFQIDDTPAILDFFGWMVGLKHRWTDQWSSNVTYAQSRQDAGLPLLPDDLSETTYLAVNLIYHPVPHMGFGIEYLHGERVNADGASGEANRLQCAFMLFLP